MMITTLPEENMFDRYQKIKSNKKILLIILQEMLELSFRKEKN